MKNYIFTESDFNVSLECKNDCGTNIAVITALEDIFPDLKVIQ